jgi:putative DNA methylase
VKSPNPAFSHVDVPLASSFVLSSKKGKEAYVQPVVQDDKYHFEIKLGKLPAEAKMGTKAARGPNLRCVIYGVPLDGQHIKGEGMAGRMGARLMAIVAEGKGGRVYLSPTDEIEEIAKRAQPTWGPETDIPHDKRSMFTPLYGLKKFVDLFTPQGGIAL